MLSCIWVITFYKLGITQYILTYSGGRSEEDKSKKEFKKKVVHYGIRSKPNRRFVWNSYLLSRVENCLHPDWLLYIMHGFVSQSNVSVFGRSIYITLIARRSNKYAGTRFLKRGANFDVSIVINHKSIYLNNSILSQK